MQFSQLTLRIQRVWIFILLENTKSIKYQDHVLIIEYLLFLARATKQSGEGHLKLKFPVL